MSGSRSIDSACRDLDVPADVLDLVVSKLTQITRETGLDYAIRVGSVVIHYFYGGSIALWRQRGAKTASFRRLAMHPALPMSASVLCRCVAAYDLCTRLDVVPRWTRITMSHIRLVLRLEEADQIRLLAAANGERWTVQRLEAEARKCLSRSSGRRPRSARVRSADAIARVCRSTSQVLDALSELEPDLGDDLAPVRDALATSLQTLERARRILMPRGALDEDPDGPSAAEADPDRDDALDDLLA